MAKAADACCIQYRLLNKGKALPSGPSGPRRTGGVIRVPEHTLEQQDHLTVRRARWWRSARRTAGRRGAGHRAVFSVKAVIRPPAHIWRACTIVGECVGNPADGCTPPDG
ncbi:MAG: hypothetical protein ACLTYN_13995 [Dysosmobacter welbionis]